MDPSEVARSVERAAAGDREAWEEIVDSFSGLVWAVTVAHRLAPAEASEVVQITWVRLLENIDRLREPARLGGWLATTARREAQLCLRKRGREVLTGDERTFDRSDRDVVSPEDVVIGNERDRQLWAAFALLTDRCRALLQMVVISGPPYAEVAAALDMPVGSIGPTRARCLNRLRRLLASVVAGDVPEEGVRR